MSADQSRDEHGRFKSDASRELDRQIRQLGGRSLLTTKRGTTSADVDAMIRRATGREQPKDAA